MSMRALNDPFLERFFSRIPAEVATSFTPDQLLAIKQAFATHGDRSHSIDIRLSLPLPLLRYYLVFIAGPERRDRARRRTDRLLRPLATISNALFLAVFLCFLTVSVLGTLYMLKSALGIDILPDAHLGLWQALSEQVRLMLR